MNKFKNHKSFNRMYKEGEITLGLHIPLENYHFGVPKMEKQVELSQLAEKYSFSSLWLRDVLLQDPSFGDPATGQIYDMFIYLTYLASQTKEIAMGTAATVLSLRHPLRVAKEAATIENLFPERLIMGVSSGDRKADFWGLGFLIKKEGRDLLNLFIILMKFYMRTSQSKEIIKISSNKGILKIKNDYRLLKENYLKAYPRQFSDFRFNEKQKIDSFFFEIYKQTRIIYKAISRFILRNIIRDHKKCVEIFNKARQNGDVCPHALAFIWWKMECEGIDSPWEIEIHTKVHETYDFEWIKERFSIFLHGTFMTHIEEILNPISRLFSNA